MYEFYRSTEERIQKLYQSAYMSERKEAAQLRRSLDSMIEYMGDKYEFIMEIGGAMANGRYELSDEVSAVLEEEMVQRFMEGMPESEREASQESNADATHGYEDLVASSPVKGMDVVLLIGPGTASAADDMAAEAKCAGFPLLGTTTQGATGNVIEVDLGGSWSVYLSTQCTLTPDREEINNRGIAPTMFVEQGEEDARNGVDTQVMAAVEYLKKTAK